jgi:hypothetical protein
LTFIWVITLFLFIAGCSGGSGLVTPVEIGTEPDETPAVEQHGGFAEMAQALSGSMGTIPADEYWEAWIEVDGNVWAADLSPDGDIHRAVGKGVDIGGSIEEFIDTHPDIFKISSDNLWLLCDEVHEGLRVVIYRQAFEGIPILDSRIDLRINSEGKVVMVGADVFPEIKEVPKAVFDSSSAREIAFNRHPFDVIYCRIFITRLPNGLFIPVWRVILGKWDILISAINGDVLFEEEMVYDLYHYTGTVKGRVNKKLDMSEVFYPGLPYVEVRFYDPIYDSYLDSAYTDVIGEYDYYSETYSQLNAKAELKGHWLNIDNYNGNIVHNPADDCVIEINTDAGIKANFYFNGSCASTETNVYFWVNKAYWYVKNIDPDFEGVDYQEIGKVNKIIDDYSGKPSCGADANSNLQFYLPGGDCPPVNWGLIADVIIHEYGHVVTTAHYGGQSEKPPGDVHEAFSDYLANTIIDDPRIGIGTYGVGSPPLRNSKNHFQWGIDYPGEGNEGDIHGRGSILAGALWDFRELLINKHGHGLGVEACDKLWWLAKFGKPKKFPDFVLELCLWDAQYYGDGDPSTPSPNFKEIKHGFEFNHNIPVPPDEYEDLDISLTADPHSEPVKVNGLTGGEFDYDLNIVNNTDKYVNVYAWVDVWRPINKEWYGPVVPPTHYIGNPVLLNLSPYQNFNYVIEQIIPPHLLPTGEIFQYYVRLGYRDTLDIIAQDYFTIDIVDYFFIWEWVSSTLDDWTLGHPSVFTQYDGYWEVNGSGNPIIEAIREIPIENCDPRYHSFEISYEVQMWNTVYDDFRLYLVPDKGGVMQTYNNNWYNKFINLECDGGGNNTWLGGVFPGQWIDFDGSSEWCRMVFRWELDSSSGIGEAFLDVYDMSNNKVLSRASGVKNPNSWTYKNDTISITLYGDFWVWGSQAGDVHFKIRKFHWKSWID